MTETGPSPGSSAPDAPVVGNAGRLAAGATALSVAVLVAGTLGTAVAVTVGAAVHLADLPDGWAAGAAALIELAGLVLAGLLGRRVWLLERHGDSP